MISICIPTYNYEITELVKELHKQCNDLSKFEIIILEDGSDCEFTKINEKITSLSNVKHIINKQNCGRSYSRNLLANTAQFGKIIFIDCDSGIIDKNYINNYTKNFDKDIVCGGTTYSNEQNEKKYSLRYTYGIHREKISAKIRNIHPNKSFATNNFMINKEIFNTIKFCEDLKEYGHEDTLFGYELQKHGYNIFHINNPVLHLGLDSNLIFLQKTLKGVDNLLKIKYTLKLDESFFDSIKICRVYNICKKFRIIWTILFLFFIFKKVIYSNLINSKTPSLLYFDFYKLGYYASVDKKHN